MVAPDKARGAPQELPSLRFSGPSAGSLSCSPRAAPKLAGLKHSMLLFLSFAEASNASEPNFRSGTPAPYFLTESQNIVDNWGTERIFFLKDQKGSERCEGAEVLYFMV